MDDKRTMTVRNIGNAQQHSHRRNFGEGRQGGQMPLTIFSTQ